MLSKFAVVMLLKIRDWPEYYTPAFELPCSMSLLEHLVGFGYLGTTVLNAGYGGFYHAYIITMKGANAIADNFDWLTERGYKL